MHMEAELLPVAKAQLGEGPHWDGLWEELYWVDIEGKQLRIYHPQTGREATFDFEQMVTAVVPAEGGGWVLALQDGIYSFNGREKPKLLARIEAGQPGNRLNDAKCDSRGRLWFGSMSMEGKQDAGAFYCLETDGSVRKILDGVGISNGIAWDESRGRMYYIDSLTRGVDALNYDPKTGSVDGRTQIFRFGDDEGIPDGMTIDSEGMLWVAHYGGACVSRWNPVTGERLGKIEVAAKNVTSCAFGGKQLDELYITTVSGNMSEEEHERWPDAGGLFVARPGVQGVRANRYSGKMD
ncbi:SMP-30/gluconolactonase/LRE family protein ['Paenibacillus yunnanensis' Narsing Rao et al. 2020]|uniref:SMP-30/gluconolactonase/LRE family protein n=1 Tax=Paenibacillus tengchongensis TaxID=2608684 RepID=UPI00124C2523|nr:SMP-30/gluconolactonase/LRE family protein [Paenibacillus tengchongensis]